MRDVVHHMQSKSKHSISFTLFNATEGFTLAQTCSTVVMIVLNNISCVPLKVSSQKLASNASHVHPEIPQKTDHCVSLDIELICFPLLLLFHYESICLAKSDQMLQARVTAEVDNILDTGNKYAYNNLSCASKATQPYEYAIAGQPSIDEETLTCLSGIVLHSNSHQHVCEVVLIPERTMTNCARYRMDYFLI